MQQEVQVQLYNKWSNGQLASESIFESMNRATPYNAEEKKERIERYRSKRNLRNFNKKIKVYLITYIYHVLVSYFISFLHV